MNGVKEKMDEKISLMKEVIKDGVDRLRTFDELYEVAKMVIELERKYVDFKDYD